MTPIFHHAVVTQSAVDLSTRSQARRERCPVTRAYPWQLLEHHFALLRPDINSAPQLAQICTRLVAGVRRDPRTTPGRSFLMRL